MRSFLSFLLSYLIAFQPLFAAQKFGSDIDLQGNKLQNAELDKLAVPDFLGFTTSSTPATPSDEGALRLFANDGKLMSINKDGTVVEYGTGEGNIVGPETSTNNGIATFDDETGEVLASNTATLSGGDIAGLTKATVDNIEIDGNTIYTTDTNGDLVLEPNGTGSIFANSIFGLRSGKALRLFDDDNSNYINVNAPSSITANRSYTIPDDANFSTFVGTGAAQTLTNKDIDGGTASNSNRLTTPKNTKTNLDSLTRKEGTIVYATDQAKLFVDNGSTLTPVGSGDGSGGGADVNAVTNPSAGTDLTGWSDSDGGSDVTRTTTSGELPLYPQVTSGIKIDPDANSEYGKYCGTIPAALKNTTLQLSWFQKPESGLDTGDFDIAVYSHTTSNCSDEGTEVFAAQDIPSLTGPIQPIAIDWSSQDYYSLRFIRNNSSTEALVVSSVFFGVTKGVKAPVVTAPVTYTPTVTLGGGATSSSLVSNSTWTRNGEYMILDLDLSFTTATATPTGVDISIPSGLTVGGNTAQRFYGNGDCFALVSSRFAVAVSAIQGNKIVSIELLAGNSFSGTGTGRIIRGSLQFPIAEWAGSGTLNVISSGGDFASNSNSTNTSSDTTSFAYGPAGSNMPNGSVGTAYVRRVRLPRNIQADERVIVETNLGSSSNIWVDAQSRFPNVYQGASLYGVEIVGVSGSTTDVDVYFNAQGYAPTNATYAGNGSPWSSITSWKWRVRIVKNAEAVGFGAATATQRGLYQAGQAPGTPTNDDATAGNVGEYIESVRSSSSPISLTNNTYDDVGSITLTPGDWDISILTLFGGTPSGGTFVQSFIGTTSGNSSTGRDNSRNQAESPSTPTSVGWSSLSVPSFRVSISTNTTYYHKVLVGFTGGTMTAFGRISARRVR